MLPLWWRRRASGRALTRRSRSNGPKLTLEFLEARDVPATLISSADPSFDNSSASATGQSEVTPRNSISDDGTYIVFVSTAHNLVADQVEDSDGFTQNVYLYNTSNQT